MCICEYSTIVGRVLPADIVNAIGATDLNRDHSWKEQALGCRMRSRCAQEVMNSRSYGVWKIAKNCENRVFDRYLKENIKGIL